MKLLGKEDDPPGGTTGRVGCGTGWMRRPCRTRDPQVKSTKLSVVIAGANHAHVIAVGVELAHPAAAAIAVVVVVAVVGSDRTADYGGAEQTGSDAPQARPPPPPAWAWVVVEARPPV